MPQSEPADAYALAARADLRMPFALRVAATLHLSDLIGDREVSVGELAEATGADTDALLRTLRYLVSNDVFLEPMPGVFAQNRWSALLAEGQSNLRNWLDLDGAGGRMDLAFSELLHVVRTGRPGYAVAHGQPIWDELAANPVVASSFSALMADHWTAAAEDIVGSFEWGEYRSVVDVGGGSGALLAAVAAAHHDLTGVVVDFEGPTRDAQSCFDATGVGARCSTRAQSFFDPLPAGADLYVLSRVLHDWPDGDAERVLRRCLDAAGTEGDVLVIEAAPPPEGDERHFRSMDLRMLVLYGGRERRHADFVALADAAGGTVVSTRTTPAGLAFILVRRQ